MDLPIGPDPNPISAPSQLYKFDDQWNALEITGSCDTTWASDRTERRSMGSNRALQAVSSQICLVLAIVMCRACNILYISP
jgi:hypothetical protein